MIPKILHYCWFGSEEMPALLQKCLKTWSKKCKEYEIKRWDNSNCSFDENDFVRTCYKEKKWAFISDYYRAKVLKEYGGIYLDTDVIVKHNFNDLLDNRCFIGYMFDDYLGTAIVGSEKNGSFVSGVVDMYDDAKYQSYDSVVNGLTPSNQYSNGQQWPPNNKIWTWYLIKRHPKVLLNNKPQKFEDVTIFDKGTFDAGKIFGKYYTRHIASGLWFKKKISFLDSIKLRMKCNPFIGTIVRNHNTKTINKQTEIYRYRKEREMKAYKVSR